MKKPCGSLKSFDVLEEDTDSFEFFAFLDFFTLFLSLLTLAFTVRAPVPCFPSVGRVPEGLDSGLASPILLFVFFGRSSRSVTKHLEEHGDEKALEEMESLSRSLTLLVTDVL